MTTIDIARHVQQSLAIAIFAHRGSMGRDEEMLGGVPGELQLYPESARAAGWTMMKSTDAPVRSLSNRSMLRKMTVPGLELPH